MRLVLATGNPGKVAEIAEAIGRDIELVPRPLEVESPDESGGSLIANARIKAHAISAATGLPALADDTGFEVDALYGAPGVEGAYFAGPHASHADNCAKVLRELKGLPDEQRGARYRTIALAAFPDGRELVAEGICDGRIAPEARGTAGFGYDSVFIPDDDDDGRTFAEMTREEKSWLSHRSRAFRALRSQLRGDAAVADSAR